MEKCAITFLVYDTTCKWARYKEYWIHWVTKTDLTFYFTSYLADKPDSCMHKHSQKIRKNIFVKLIGKKYRKYNFQNTEK